VRGPEVGVYDTELGVQGPEFWDKGSELNVNNP
jgi:hypothetical protein